MKFNSLQLGKAMSAALFVLLLSVVGMKNAFAQNQVATLQHGEDISVFYGANAFVEAHNAAADGDIVTLSSGGFTVPSEITKAITLRGAGMVANSGTNTNPTFFTGNVYFNVNNDSIPFSIEGIQFRNYFKPRKLINPKITRCSFQGGVSGESNTYGMIGAQFVNCIINSFSFDYSENTTLINSVVWCPGGMTTSHNVTIFNSFFGGNAYARDAFHGVSAYNSVIIRVYNSYGITYGDQNEFYNCIGINLRDSWSNPFGSGYTSGCITRYSYDAVFESFTGGDFNLEEQFILKDNIATGFLGTDGTQVGIHGGLVPYSPRPSYMKIEHCNVANRSTIDGKLSVEIEVVTEEE